MKLYTHRAFFVVLMAALISGWCGGRESQNPPSTPTPSPETSAPKRLPVLTKKEVTFYPTYGYRVGTSWNAQLRGWVHSDRKIAAEGAARFLKHTAKCNDAQMDTVRSRSADFMDDDEKFEQVKVKFASDPDDKEYEFSKTESEGIYKLDLVLTDEKARQLQGQSSNGWLTYRAVSKDHTGLGRVRLIEPDPNGVSLVSDIDDTIKITEVPAGQATVLRNTFCLDFRDVPEPDILAKYKLGDDIPVHYVSGGPEQLFGPLYDFLITGPGGFPEGTFHLKFFPKDGSIASVSNIVRSVISSLDATYNHKLLETNTLMDKFPNRKFILVGDSGEIDPEVYNEIKKNRPAQVKEIVIRDVINDAVVNPFRLAGMTPIPVSLPICIEQKHLKHLKKMVEKFHPEHQGPYIRNPACGKDKEG